MATDLKKPAKTVPKKANKNKKQTVAFRNLLAQTFPRYWPQLSQSHSAELFELLIEAKSTHPNWFSTKKSTEARPVHYGLSSSTKKIQSSDVKLLVLSADLKPRYVINQIILKAIASNEGISIFLVSGLQSPLQAIVDFSCFAFVITDAGWQQLPELRQWCTENTRSHYPIPEIITSYYKQRKNVLASTNDIDMECDSSNTIPTSSAVETVHSSDLHLPKVYAKRAFVPQNAANFKPVAFKIQTIKHTKNDFISLELPGGSSDQQPNKNKRKREQEQNKEKKRKKVKSDASIIYQSLIIHKVQNSSGNKEKKLLKKNKKKAK